MKLRYLHRVKEILGVFLEEEFGYFIKKAQLHHYVPFAKRWKASLKKKSDGWKPEVHLRQALERLGPTFVKFGQILSLRPDLLPQSYIHELEKMQDAVPPVSFKEIKKVLKEELGDDPAKIFASIETKPKASASLAQVYKAKLKSGETVAVKVQRPGIEHVVREDIEIMMFIAHWLEKRKVLKGFPLVGIVQEFKHWTLREIDFSYEAVNMARVGDNFKKSKNVIIPKVFESYSTRRVLTTQFIKGTPIDEVQKLKRTKKPQLIIQKCYRAIIEMILGHGLFHADPHPGNILVSKGKIAFVDFGIVGRFDETLRNTVVKLFVATLNNDPDKVLNAVMELQTQRGKINKKKLKHELRDILDQIHLGKLKDIKLSLVLSNILDTIHRHRISVPVDFILFAKTVITMEGVGLRYSPNFKLLKETGPIIEKEKRRARSVKNIKKKIKRQAFEYKELFEKAPNYLMETLQHLSEGRLDIEITPQELTDIRVEMEHSSGNIAIGLMIAAITVSSAMIMQVIKEPLFLGMPYLSFIGFCLAFFMGTWLLKRTIFVKIN